MNNDKSNQTQIEELEDDQLQDAQGGFKVEIEGIKTRLTRKELAGRRFDGVKGRVADGVKLRDNGTKIRK